MTPPLISTPTSQIRFHTQKGLALAGMGQLPEATVAFWQAVQGVEKKSRRAPGYRTDLFQTGRNLRPYQGLVEVLARLSMTGAGLPPELQEFGPTPQAAAFALTETAKTRVMLEALAQAPRNTSRTEPPPDLRQRQEAWHLRLAANEAQWEKAVAGGKDGLREAIDHRKKLIVELETLTEELRQTQPLDAALDHPKPVPVKEVPRPITRCSSNTPWVKKPATFLWAPRWGAIPASPAFGPESPGSPSPGVNGAFAQLPDRRFFSKKVRNCTTCFWLNPWPRWPRENKSSLSRTASWDCCPSRPW